MPWIAKPTSRATNRACSTLPSVSAENIDVGMMLWMNSIVPPDSCALSASSAPLPGSDSMSRPEPGLIRLPTTSPMASASVDIARKYTNASPPTLPTVAAWRTDPMPSTMVQKMTGAIIILIRSTNMVPRKAMSLPTPGAASPTITPPTTAAMTARYSQCVRSRLVTIRSGDGAGTDSSLSDLNVMCCLSSVVPLLWFLV